MLTAILTRMAIVQTMYVTTSKHLSFVRRSPLATIKPQLQMWVLIYIMYGTPSPIPKEISTS